MLHLTDQYGRLFGRMLRWSIAIPVILMLVVVGILVARVQAMAQANVQTLQITERIGYAQRAYRLIVDMETGFRGYFLTRKESFLDPYREADALLPVTFKSLRQAQGADSQAATELDLLEQKVAEWKAAAETSLKLESVSEASFERRKVVMDTIRETVEKYISGEESLRAKGVQEMKEATDRSLVLTVGLGLVAAAILAFFTRRQLGAVSSMYANAIEVQKEAQDQLRASNEKLEKEVARRTQDLIETNSSLLSTNQELEAFCYSVSHDLRAPLRGIDGFSQAMIEDYDGALDASGKQYLAFIREGVQRMGHLIDDLLNLSRLTRAPMQKSMVDLSALAKATAARLLAQVPGAQRVKVTILPEAQVEGDEGLLGVLLENLIGNAIKFSEKSPAPSVEFGQDLTQPEAPYFVRDNGAGFEMEYVDKLFGAFQRLHSAREFPGTGIGLATVRRIVTRHGGRVWAVGKLDEGATFYFTLANDKTTGVS